MTLTYNGGSGHVRNAQFQGSTIRIEKTEPDNPMQISDNTFTGPFSPQKSVNWITLRNDTQTVIRRNTGAFGVNVGYYDIDKPQATIMENRFAGVVNVVGSGKATLYDNTIAGGLYLRGPYNKTADPPASASVISNTITVSDSLQFPQAYVVRADYGAQLVVTRSRLENQRKGRVLQTVSPDSSKPKVSITVMDGWLSGYVDMNGSTDLTLVNNREIRGTIIYGDQVTALIGGNKIYGDVRVSEDSRTTYVNNVMPEGTVWLYKDAGGEFTRNPLLQ